MIQELSLMKFINQYCILPLLIYLCFCCKGNNSDKTLAAKVRQPVDTVGFAQYPWQMDSIMARIDRRGWNKSEGIPWRFAVCPHDDYTYAGKLYPEVLQNIKAHVVILLGVAHRASVSGIEDSLVFDTYQAWKGPWKDVKVSPMRDQIYSLLSGRYAVINDSLHSKEHSVESMIPFLQYFNRDVTIVPVLVPAMNPARMEECGRALAAAIKEVTAGSGVEWGSDFALVVTTDAVHYGNEDWGGADMAPFGCDSLGNQKAVDLEKEIVANCLTGDITPEKIRLFNSYTLKECNYREYKWTWCGRYSVPVAMYTAYYLGEDGTLSCFFSGYSSSISDDHIPVDDINMGRTAIATPCHWVGYAAAGYR
jgi:AmmeMemoRadiSam system protein B